MRLAKLSGSDNFHLLIDRKIKRFGLCGNISRVHFQLDSSADLETIAKKLRQNSNFRQVANIRYTKNWPFAPTWISTNDREPHIVIAGSLTENTFRVQVINGKVDNENGLVRIDLCELDDDSKHVVISLHHALFDHQGMINFIQALNGDFDGDAFPKSKSSSFWKSCRNFCAMTVYMLSRENSKLGSLLTISSSHQKIPNYDSLKLNPEESKRVESHAWSAGARIGTSTYLISAVARTVNGVLKARGENAPYLWFSTPHNLRKLGTKGHLYSNQLSFLFFKLTATDLNSNSACVESMNLQLRGQIKQLITEKYAGLMDSLRYVPLFVYEQMVNLSAKGKLASFGFSDLGTDQLHMDTFCGQKVVGVLRYPPVPTPPGFNVAVVRSNEQFEFIFGYVTEAISESEMEEFKIKLKDHLLGND